MIPSIRLSPLLFSFFSFIFFYEQQVRGVFSSRRHTIISLSPSFHPSFVLFDLSLSTVFTPTEIESLILFPASFVLRVRHFSPRTLELVRATSLCLRSFPSEFHMCVPNTVSLRERKESHIVFDDYIFPSNVRITR